MVVMMKWFFRLTLMALRGIFLMVFLVSSRNNLPRNYVFRRRLINLSTLWLDCITFEQETLQFDVFLPGPQLFGPAAGRIDKGQIVDVESIAAFFHANFHINENLTLFAGLRYTDEGKELTNLPAVCVVNPITCIALRMPTFTSPQPAPVDVSTQEPSWTLGIRRFVDDDMMLWYMPVSHVA